jgi:hypothetical protein
MRVSVVSGVAPRCIHWRKKGSLQKIWQKIAHSIRMVVEMAIIWRAFGRNLCPVDPRTPLCQ